MYDLKELEAFVSVVNSGSLTRTAEKLNLPKSTLSRRIRQLEDSLGQPLLRRQSRCIAPNEAGRVFYRYCNQILALAHRGREALDELQEGISGTLELRCHEAFVRGWFFRVVEAFLARHEDLQVSVSTLRQPPRETPDSVSIWLGETGDTDLRKESLGWLSQGVYGHPDYFVRHGRPETPEDLRQHAWVDILGAVAGDVTLVHPRHGNHRLSPPTRSLTVDQFCLQGDAIARGQGLGLVPHWLAQRRLEAHPGDLELCMPDWQGPMLPVSLLYSHGVLPRRVRAFIRFLRESVPVEWRARLPEADLIPA